MATANVLNISRIRGRIVADPTDLTSNPDYGGTPLGLTRSAEFRFGLDVELVLNEAIGNAPDDAVCGGQTCVLACVLREFDNDMLTKVFIDAPAGATSGKRRIRNSFEGEFVPRGPGTLLSTKAFKLLFVPENYARDPFVLIYAAMPVVDKNALMALRPSEEVGMLVGFYGILDASSRVYDIGRREDLTL